jgi:hypothetical protein
VSTGTLLEYFACFIVFIKDMLNAEAKEEISRQLRHLLSTIGISSEKTNGFLDKTKSLLNPVTEKIEEKTAQLWNKIVSPMYGSACIHEYLNQKHVRNKLFTVEGASQHSLHVDEHRNIVPYFYTIQDSVARFFYTEIVQQPVNLRQDNPQSLFFRINDANVAEVHWQVDGGVLLESSDSRAKVVFFKDARRHVVRVCGKYKNGIEFCEKMVM